MTKELLRIVRQPDYRRRDDPASDDADDDEYDEDEDEEEDGAYESDFVDDKIEMVKRRDEGPWTKVTPDNVLPTGKMRLRKETEHFAQQWYAKNKWFLEEDTGGEEWEAFFEDLHGGGDKDEDDGGEWVPGSDDGDSDDSDSDDITSSSDSDDEPPRRKRT